MRWAAGLGGREPLYRRSYPQPTRVLYASRLRFPRDGSRFLHRLQWMRGKNRYPDFNPRQKENEKRPGLPPSIRAFEGCAMIGSGLQRSPESPTEDGQERTTRRPAITRRPVLSRTPCGISGVIPALYGSRRSRLLHYTAWQTPRGLLTPSPGHTKGHLQTLRMTCNHIASHTGTTLL